MLENLGPTGFSSKQRNVLPKINRLHILCATDEGESGKVSSSPCFRVWYFQRFQEVTSFLNNVLSHRYSNWKCGKRKRDIAFILSPQIVKRSLIVFPPKPSCPHPKSTYASSQLHLRIPGQDCSLIHMHRLTHWISDILPCTRRKQPLESNETIRLPCSPSPLVWKFWKVFPLTNRKLVVIE